MKTIQKLFTLFLLCSLPSWAFCQPVFTATDANLSQTVNRIMGVYGNQINLSAAQIEAFIFPFVHGSVPIGVCPPPIPQIMQSGNGAITFNWTPISQSNSYGTYHLNLSTGVGGSGTTSASGISYAGLQGLHLFGFYSNCGNNSFNGPSSIIIVDVEILFPEDENMECVCEDPSEANLLGNYPYFNYFWEVESKCQRIRYLMSVDGYFIEEEGIELYHSKLSFIYDADLASPSVLLLPHCAENATSSGSNPLHVGSGLAPHVFDLSFTTSNLLINFPMPPTSFVLKELVLTNCGCEDKKQEGAIQPRKRMLPFDSFQAFPNPALQQTQLQYELSEPSEVRVNIYDLWGRMVKEALAPIQQAKGYYQMELDISDWPMGIYYCQLSTTQFTKTIKLKKE